MKKGGVVTVSDLMANSNSALVQMSCSMVDDDTTPVSSLCVLFENERWQALGRSFSWKGLAMTDRARYSSADGRVSWNTLEQAESALLPHCWTWAGPEWEVDVLLDDGTSAEWRYHDNFSKGDMPKGSLAKTASSYVRRRCLKRGCASWTPAWRRWTPSLARRTRGRKVCRLSLFLLSLFALN